MVAYNRCLQVTFILVQILFLLLGGGLIGVGAWLEVSERSLIAAIQQQTFLVGPYLIIAAGCVIVIISAIGMIGAFCDKKINRFLLVFYIILVVLVFLAQLVGGILGFVFRDRARSIISQGLMTTQRNYGGSGSTNQTITNSWNFIQERLRCCGVNNVSDWLNSGANFDGGEFPSSCCISVPRTCNMNTTTPTDVHMDGCIVTVENFIRNQLLIVASIAIAFILGEIVVILMAFCLVCCTDFED